MARIGDPRRIGLVGGERATCTFAYCGRLHHARGMCLRHYQDWRQVHLPVNVRCSVEGCERRAHGHGFCKPHYDRWRRVSSDAPRAYCTVDGCDGVAEARGYCDKHLSRWKRWHDVHHEPPPQRRKQVLCAGGCGRLAEPDDRWCVTCELAGVPWRRQTQSVA